MSFNRLGKIMFKKCSNILSILIFFGVMEIREVMTQPVDLPVSTSPQASIREKFRQEIEQTPEEILGVALEFLLFLKSRTSSESIVKQPPETLP